LHKRHKPTGGPWARHECPQKSLYPTSASPAKFAAANWLIGPLSSGLARSGTMTMQTHKTLVVIVSIDANTGFRYDAHLNPSPLPQDSKLLELFQLFEWVGRQRRKVQQE